MLSRVLLRLLPVVLFAGLAVLCVLALRAQTAPPDVARPVIGVVGQDAPYVHMFPAGALKQGRPVLVNFFASWCLPCAAEQKALEECARAGDAPVFGINYKDTYRASQAFLEKYGNPYVAIAPDPNGRHAVDWGVSGVPETFVIDGAGRVRRRIAEPLTAEVCAARVLPLLQEGRAE